MKTSGQKARQDFRCGGRRDGFTFLELIIVIAVLGLMFTIGTIKLSSSIPKYSRRTAAKELGTNIEQMRLAAINRGAVCGIRYHFDEQEPSRPNSTGQGYSLLVSGGDQSELRNDSLLQGRQGIDFMVLDRIIFENSYPAVRLVSVEMRGTGQSTDGEPDVYLSPTGTTGSHIAVLGTKDGRYFTLVYNALTGAVDFVEGDRASFEDFED
jgi:prepilin-type N-terminal cleavage/methylation domain-containing protein